MAKDHENYLNSLTQYDSVVLCVANQILGPEIFL